MALASTLEHYIIAGVIDLGCMEVFSIFHAMQRGLIDRETGLMLLETQTVLCGLIDPKANERLTLEEALQRNLVDNWLFLHLQNIRHAHELVDISKSGMQNLFSITTAIQEDKIQQNVGLRVLTICFATGRLKLTSRNYLADIDNACKDGLIGRELQRELEVSSKCLIDPNAAKKVTLSEIMEICIVQESTGLKLLPVKRLAGDMICLRSGKKVSIFSAGQEGLIDRQVAIRLLEAQMFAGGIPDPKTGHRLTIEEAVKHNLMDQDIACSLLVQQLQNGGIIDIATGQRVTLDEAVKNSLVSSRHALLVLESLGIFRGLLRPESGEVLTIADAIQEQVLSEDVAIKILEHRQRIHGLYVPENREILSWEVAVQRGILNEHAAGILQSPVIPDITGIHTAGYVKETGVQPASASLNSSTYPTESNVWDMHRNQQTEFNKKLMNFSYINIHSGLLLINSKEISISELLPEAYRKHSISSSISVGKETSRKEDHVDKDTVDHTNLKRADQQETWSSVSVESTHPNTKVPTAPSFQKSLENQSQQVIQTNFNEDKPLQHPERPLVGSPSEEDSCLQDMSNSFISGIKSSNATSQSSANAYVVATQPQTLTIAQRTPSFSPREIMLNLENSVPEDSDRGDTIMSDFKEQDVSIQSNLNHKGAAQLVVEPMPSEIKSEDLELKSVSKEPTNSSNVVRDSGAAGKYNFGLGEEDTLTLLTEQLMHGGIVDANSNQKLLLNEAVALGTVSSHTALKLMERLGLFSGFFDSKTCEPLTIPDVIDEGLMDETLLQRVFTSDKAISGIVDVQSNTLYSVHDALIAGLVDEDMARRILDVQVITGGIFDIKRGKRISVTLASSLNLVKSSDQDDLVKLEKASKGKSTDKTTKQKLISLQIETSGITDPHSKKTLSVVEALKKGVISREDAILHLTKQIADGGILHNSSGMRFSASDALKHKIINHDLFKGLAEHECLKQLEPVISPGEGLRASKNQDERSLKVHHNVTASTHSSMAKGSQMIPYIDIVKKCKIDVITGQRFLDLNFLSEVKFTDHAFSTDAVKHPSQDCNTSTKLQFESLGADTVMTEGKSIAPLQEYRKDLDPDSLEDDSANGKLCNARNVKLLESPSADLTSQKLLVRREPTASSLLFAKQKGNVFDPNDLTEEINGTPEVCKENIISSPGSVHTLVQTNLRSVSSEDRLHYGQGALIERTSPYDKLLHSSETNKSLSQPETIQEQCSLYLTADDSHQIDKSYLQDAVDEVEDHVSRLSAFSVLDTIDSPFTESDPTNQILEVCESSHISEMDGNQKNATLVEKVSVKNKRIEHPVPSAENEFSCMGDVTLAAEPIETDLERSVTEEGFFEETPKPQPLFSDQFAVVHEQLLNQSMTCNGENSFTAKSLKAVELLSSDSTLGQLDTSALNNVLQQVDKENTSNTVQDPEKITESVLQNVKESKDDNQEYDKFSLTESERDTFGSSLSRLPPQLTRTAQNRIPLHTGDNVQQVLEPHNTARKTTEETPKDSHASSIKQSCLEHEENLVSYLSMLRDIEVRLGPVCPVPLELQEVQEQLRQTEILDKELKDLLSPVSQELDLVKRIVSRRPREVPKQLLRALEKDAKNLEKSLTSVRDTSESRVKQLHSALRMAKAKVVAEHEGLESKLKSLLQWVKDATDSLDNLKTDDDLALDPNAFKSDLEIVESLKQPVADTRLELDNIAFEIQLFISEKAQDLTPQQSRVLLRLLNELQKSFRGLSERLFAREEVMQLRQRHAKHNAEIKTLQEQKAVSAQGLEELSLWTECTEKAVSDHGAIQGNRDLSTLQDQHRSMQNLRKDVKAQGDHFAKVLKAAEDFLVENKTKMDPKELEAFQKKLQQAKEQYHGLLEKTVDAEKQLETAVSTAVLEETKKSKTAEELKVNLGKIESLLHQVLPTISQQPATLTDGRETSKSEMSNCGPATDQAIDLINNLYERKKTQHQEMWAQQQNFILTIQSAQDFLDKHGSSLPTEERQQLQDQLARLKDEYSTSLSQAQLQLKHAQSLKDELQNFLHDHGEFESWLQRSEELLNNMQKGKVDAEAVQNLLHQQADFSEDVISHKGDLRYITIAGQKAIEAEKAAADQCKEDVEVAVAGSLVKNKLEDASKRYSALHSKCSKLGSHLNSVLSRFQQFQEGSDATLAWLQNTASAVENILSEPVASKPDALQIQLEKAKSMQGDLAEREVQVEKVHMALRALLEVQEDPSPDCESIQATTDSIDSQFQDLSTKMSAHSDVLQKSVAQSQSVQEGLENLLHWLEGMEKALEDQRQIPMSSSSIQESLATNTKLRQDIGSRRGSLDATGEMVAKFMETADSATASALQSKLLAVTERFNKVCLRQSQQESALKEILPKVEKYEQLSDNLKDFSVTRFQLLASGNQPDKDIAQFSEQIQELNLEIKQQEEHLITLDTLANELSTYPVLLDATEHLQKVQALKNDFSELQKAARERERDALSCQEELEHFKKLVGIMRKWLKDNEENVPAAEDSLGTQEIQIRLQKIQDLLQEWKMKGPDMEAITQKGSELESRIMEITASESQLRGSVLMASLSPVGNVNGYHTCQDLTGIQCDLSETSQKYEDLGRLLQSREEQLSSALESMQKVKQEADCMLSWLESKEDVISAVKVSPTKTEMVKAQAAQNKELISELEKSSGKVESLKASLRELLEKYPNSPEAETWKKMLENLNQKWNRANQATSERQQKLEESANQLATFQTAASQLRPWLTEKELMMSVLGPLSVDPNMLNAQKQQVQFMLKEFEARKDQYEELKHAAYGILTGPGDESPSTNQVEEEFHEVSKKWTELTNRLNSRADQIDQATVKSTQYQDVLQGLTNRIKQAGQRLGAQPAIITQPDAVKQQLQETSGIRSDLDILAQEVTEAQLLCNELSALVVEPYLKDELQKRLDTVALPLKGMEDLAADRVNRLQSALASSQQFQQMFDELRNWLDEKQIELAKCSPVSSKLEKLQTLLQDQEEFQKSLNQNSGSYEMIINEGESLLLSLQPGEEKTTLQNHLTSLKANWEELGKKATERHSRLKDCLQKAQKYGRHVEDLLPWLEDCEAQMKAMEVTLDPVQLEAQLLRSKALQGDIDKKRSLLEMMNSSADLLIEAAEIDDDEILEQKAHINQRVDSITEQLHIKAGSIDEMAVRLRELKDTFKNIDKKLEGAKHLLEIYAALGPQACSSKNLENMRSHQDMLTALDAQIRYLKDLIQGLTGDAPEGSDVSTLIQQADDVQQDFENVKREVNECCLSMESKLQGIGQFHSHVRDMFSQLTDLDDELDNMGPVGRDIDCLKSQTEAVQKFIDALQGLKSDIESSEKKCREMLENEGGPDLIGLMRELGTLNKQCVKLTERGRNRQEQLESTLQRVDDFNKKLHELKHQIMTAEGSSTLQGVVGTEVDTIKQQLDDFKVFQKEHVDSLQVRLQQVNGLGQGLIQSADKNCDVHGLEHDTEELNTKWNTLNKKVAERVTQLQEALLHCGKFQDALEPLLSWLTDTEDLIANQKPPSAEYKVVKAQIQEQRLLQRLLDDRRATVEMIQAEGVRIAEGAEPADQEKISRQLDILAERWSSLLQKAQSRQKQLDDILVLAKQFHETTEPIFDWLSATEKKLANSEPMGTQTGKIQQQITRHKSLEDDITVHETAVRQAGRLGDSLSALCSQAEQDRLTQRLDFLQSRYSELQDLCSRKGALLGQALSNARLFGEDEVEVLNWLAEVEDRLGSVCVKDYKLEVLQKQHTHHLALGDDISNRKKNVDQAVKNGQALLKQTTGEEVLLIQEKLDGIKTRYSEITVSSGKALRTLEQALQLASKFQTTHDELTGWLRRVEEELVQNSGQPPAGDQIPQFQQRQKELKKEAMEYRIVLDTINEVGSALLELVPWRAREGLDKLVSDANEQYRLVSTTIAQRVDQIDAAVQKSQQYEQAADAELAWVAETKRKLLALAPVCLEQDKTTAQLQVQKAFSVDIIRHKDSIDELLSTQEEILGTCGDEQKAALQEKTKILLQQYEDVSHLNSERYARLEKAQGLVGQFWETYEELNPWIEEMQALISQLPPPAVDSEILRQQQEEIRQLRESVSEHKPHIDKLLKIGPHLCELNPEEGAGVQEKYSTSEKMYLGIKEDVRKIAMALDDAVAQAAQFHDKIGPMLETLEGMASRLCMPPLIPAEVEKIRDCISENKNSLMELEKLQPSFEALKHRGEELISRSQGADMDPAVKDIQDKLDQLVFFWEDIKARAEEREMKFLDVLELAEKFWLDMGSILTTIKDTYDIVHDLESPGIDPSMIKQQIEAADTIKEETDGLHEELEFIRILGADLIFACGETEKPEVKKSIDEINNAWENLKKTWSERLEKLRDAMADSVQYQDTLQAMFDWLDNAVIKLCDMPPVGTDINTVKEQINEMKEFKVEVYQQQIEMEKLNHQGELMLKKAIDDTDRDIIKGPLTELKHLWENLGEKITHRQHKLEAALLALGQFQHALAEVMSWLTHTHELLDAQKPISGDPKVIEVELAKHHVLKNDVLAHQSTVKTVSKAGNELVESSAGDDANSLKIRLEKFNQLWESLLQKTEEREQQLDMALQQAEGFTGEIEEFLQWQNRLESQLSTTKATGGLPETAREQLQVHMELYDDFKAHEELFKQLLDKGHIMLLSKDDAAGSITEQNVSLLKRKWQSIANKVEERKVKLEEALVLATDFQNFLQEFINWLTQAEQSLNIAPPPSLILDTVLFQIDEHKIFVNEVNVHREQIIELDKTGNQLKFLSQKQDVVLIKNLLLSVQSRWEKVVQRSVERGRSLDDARKRAKQFHEAWKKLIDWLEEAENHLDSDMEISNDPDKIKLQLTKHKEFQKTLGSKQPVYDTTVRTGRSLKEKALLSDDVQKLDHLLGEVRDKWDTVCGKSVERQHKLEEALLFSGQFMDALQALVDWLYKVEPQLAEDQPVHGDLDLVMNLMDAHKVFQKELGKRTGSVQAVKRSARELLESSREDTTWVKVQLQELSTRWDTVCKLSVSKQTRLEQALKQAEEFRNTVHMLLEWLSEAEQTLRFRGALPDDAESLQSLIDVHKEFMKKVEEKHIDVNTAVSMGEGILTVCHPDCITTIKHWITIIRARFEEVLTWGNQHQQRLQTALSELLANSDLLDELLSWIQWAETTLIQRDQEPMPQNLEQVKALISEHQAFMEEMTQKQPDVDKVTKTYKRKTTDPNHASFNDKSRSRKASTQPTPPALLPLSQSETKNPRIIQLSARWQQVWLLALERQRKLNDALDRLEELKEFANFDFDIWRKKYMRWMNHKKSRVMDFFRRIDKDQDGKITRQEFIDGILASKFPTTKLEMTAVADIFDRDGDGYIDYYEFVAALHPNKDAYRPTTDADKIEDEVTRQVAQCKCAKRFQVEQIGENKYRFFLGNQFGDSQQLRLVRILRSTVMVRVGGGWMALDEFLVKNDPCRARGRTNLELREKFILPEGVSQGMTPFRSRGRRSKPSSRTASPTRSSSSASQSNHSCTSVPSSPATPASGSKTPLQPSRCYEKPWLVNSKAGTPFRCCEFPDFQIPSLEVTPAQSSKMKKTAIHTSRSSLTGETSTPSGAKLSRSDPKKSTSRAGSRTGSRASSRRGSDASDFDLLETQSACSDTSESSAAGGPGNSRRGLSKPSKIPTISKKASSTPKTPGTKR